MIIINIYKKSNKPSTKDCNSKNIYFVKCSVLLYNFLRQYFMLHYYSLFLSNIKSVLFNGDRELTEKTTLLLDSRKIISKIILCDTKYPALQAQILRRTKTSLISELQVDFFYYNKFCESSLWPFTLTVSSNTPK